VKCYITVLALLVARVSGLMVSLDSRLQDKESFIKYISFCKLCTSPEHEGSLAIALAPTNCKMDNYRLLGEVVYGVPNHGEKETMVNWAQIQGNIVMLDRGKIQVAYKALHAQEAGAIAVIIADDGSCRVDFSHCGQRAGNRVDGFAPYDSIELWLRINIPVFLVTLETVERMRGLMSITRTDMPYLGFQNISSPSKPYHHRTPNDEL
jgi:hypothetical protein